MTEYVILNLAENEHGWKEVARVEASSEGAAIRKTVNGTSGGVFIATPARHFRPRTVKVERVEKVRIS
jgi:hypothetical protein